MDNFQVVIIGRPNVGKSCLFNRLAEKSRAMVGKDKPLTRDRLSADLLWQNKAFQLVDTPGLSISKKDNLSQLVRQQVDLAILQADLLIFLLDAQTGLCTLDYEIARILRKSGKKVVFVANKVENQPSRENLVDFAALGLGMPLAISARHNLGIRQLKSALIKYLPRAQKKDFGQALKIAIVGRPNVGKSSFFNTLLGSARAVVDDQPGTTRDSVDSLLVSEGSSFLLIDTAGLCRGRESQTLAEIYSWAHSKKAIAQADVCLVLADCQEGLDKLDLDILRFCSAVKGKATILCMNKVDLIDKGQIKSYASSLKLRLGNLSYLPVIFTSAKTGFNLKPALRLAKEVYAQAREKIPTPLLNKILLQAQKKKLPPFIEGKSGKIYYALEKGARPPTFLIYVNSARLFPMAYLKYLENQIRSYFALRAVPIRIELKSKGVKG